MKKIGIIAGAGPEAGASLFMQIIRLYQAQGYKQDCDFPYITLLNIPFAPMLTLHEIEIHKEVLRQQLQEAFDTLNKADVIAIACNTLHTLLKAIKVPDKQFINIVKVTKHALQQQNVTKALFLGTNTSVSLDLYKEACDLVYPTDEEQKVIDAIIIDILNNNYSGSAALTHIVTACREREYFQGVILGCTELPLLHNREPIKVDTIFFDTLHILAQALVQ